MEIRAGAKYLRGSPRKVRLVTRAVNGLAPAEALARLSLMRQKPRLAIMKVIKQAIANAKNNQKIDGGDLLIKQIWVNEGPRFKRIDKSHGARFDGGVIRKKFYHLEVILKSKEEKIEKTEGKPTVSKTMTSKKEIIKPEVTQNEAKVRRQSHGK